MHTDTQTDRHTADTDTQTRRQAHRTGRATEHNQIISSTTSTTHGANAFSRTITRSLAWGPRGMHVFIPVTSACTSISRLLSFGMSGHKSEEALSLLGVKQAVTQVSLSALTRWRSQSCLAHIRPAYSPAPTFRPRIAHDLERSMRNLKVTSGESRIERRSDVMRVC
jgi:hypothetical protein